VEPFETTVKRRRSLPLNSLYIMRGTLTDSDALKRISAVGRQIALRTVMNNTKEAIKEQPRRRNLSAAVGSLLQCTNF
jgi:hypothetical protein